jgi:hypothetical protein
MHDTLKGKMRIHIAPSFELFIDSNYWFGRSDGNQLLQQVRRLHFGQNLCATLEVQP